MPPPKHPPTNHSTPRDFKHRVLLQIHKLSDRDTHASAATELDSIAKTLPPQSISPFLSSISLSDPSDKSPARKQCIHLISTLSETHGNLLSPYLSKLISTIIHRLRDPNSTVRTACVTAAGSIAAHVTKPPFTSVVKPFVDALVTEQDLNAQVGASLCMASVVRNTPKPDTVYLNRLLVRIEKLLNNDSFKAKAALLTVVVNVVGVGGASSSVTVRNLVNVMIEFVSKSDDWSVRKAAAEVLEKLAIVETGLLRELKSFSLKILETKRFDKVKSVRETMNRMIEAWNAIPDVAEEVSPPPESRSSKEESDTRNQLTTPRMISTRTSKETGPAMFCKLDRKKPVDQKQRSLKHVTKRALFGEDSDEKMNETRNHEDRSRCRIVESNGSLNINSIEQESEDLSLIRNQLVQIETQQSNLYDLLEKFIESSVSGMESLESRVRGVESTLDEIAFDLAKSTDQVSNAEPTLCCKLPGADLLSSKLWKNKNVEPYSLPTVTGFHLRAGLIKNPLAEVRQM